MTACTLHVTQGIKGPGSINCLEPGPCHSDKSVCVCAKRADIPSQTQPCLNSPRGQLVRIKQPWKELVTGQLQLIREVPLQSLSSDRVRTLYSFYMCDSLCPRNGKRFPPSDWFCTISFATCPLYIFFFQEIYHRGALLHALILYLRLNNSVCPEQKKSVRIWTCCHHNIGYI
jgi:hypothetical protein